MLMNDLSNSIQRKKYGLLNVMNNQIFKNKNVSPGKFERDSDATTAIRMSTKLQRKRPQLVTGRPVSSTYFWETILLLLLLIAHIPAGPPEARGP